MMKVKLAISTNVRAWHAMPLLVVLVIMAVASNLAAQTYQPRHNYGAFLEPTERILHGAGQDPVAWQEYWSVMDAAEKPVVYMHYENLRVIRPTWARDLKEVIAPQTQQNQMVVIQFGLELVGMTETIPNGDFDAQIEVLLDGIQELGLPVYIRLGYEFNGLAWNGYQPEPYKASFIYLTNKIRERDLEIATVWNYVPDRFQPDEFMDYYPGSEYVDWWSINFFEPSQVASILATNFLDSAEVYQKPVLIGESTPKDIGVLDGQADWDAWFQPFFNRIASEPGVKMTGYINWNWANFPQWSTWGDARLEQNEVVAQNFRDQMDNPIFYHEVGEADFRSLLGYDDDQAPTPVDGLQLAKADYPVRLAWNPSEDASGIARYKIWYESNIIGFTADTSISLPELPTDENVQIQVSVVDRAGNEAVESEPFEFFSPTPEPSDELIDNGNFDEGTGAWNFTFYAAGVNGTFVIDDSGLMAGPNSAHVTISQTTGTNWHIQLEQPLEVLANHEYEIKYQVVSNGEAPLEMWLQKSTEPFTGFARRTINATSEIQRFTERVVMESDESVFMRFMFGTSGLNQFWIDSVSVRDLGQVGAVSNEDGIDSELPSQISLDQNYPNPFNPATNIRFSLPGSAFVRLKVYSILGTEVAELANGTFPAGKHEVSFDASGLASGLYFYRLETPGAVLTRKMTLLR